MKVLQEFTRAVYASFVSLLLESTKILVTIVNEQPNSHFQVNRQYLNIVELTDFLQLKTYYETQLFVMLLKEDGTANTVFLKEDGTANTVYLSQVLVSDQDIHERLWKST